MLCIIEIGGRDLELEEIVLCFYGLNWNERDEASLYPVPIMVG